MHACAREQGKLRLTILQTLHVGGVFSKRTLHHARDVREGAGKGSLSWHNMWNGVKSKVHQPGGCPGSKGASQGRGAGGLVRRGIHGVGQSSRVGFGSSGVCICPTHRTHEGVHMRKGLHQDRNCLACVCLCSCLGTGDEGEGSPSCKPWVWEGN